MPAVSSRMLPSDDESVCKDAVLDLLEPLFVISGFTTAFGAAPQVGLSSAAVHALAADRSAPSSVIMKLRSVARRAAVSGR